MGEFADFMNQKDAAEAERRTGEPAWVPSSTPPPIVTRDRDGHEICDAEILKLSDMVLGPAALVNVVRVNNWLDEMVSETYQGQPLAQDWARVAKAAEEVGEAIAALIAMTGQNPRKGVHGTLEDLLGELGDIAWTAIFAIQHFTGSRLETARVMQAGLDKASDRAAKAGY